MRANRALLARAVCYLVTHQVAQEAARPHARVLLTSSQEGACAYVDADLRDPDAILAAAARTLDFSRPLNQAQVAPAKMRDKQEIATLFCGLTLVPPGLVPVPQWRPRSALEASSPAALWAGVARKP